MNVLHEIEISIDTDGRVKVEIRGMKGPACVEVTREMEQLLGGKVVERTHTHEYDQQPDEAEQADWLRGGGS